MLSHELIVIEIARNEERYPQNAIIDSYTPSS